MPLTFHTGAVLAQNTVFQDRVAVAMYYVARQILGNQEDPAIGYEKRRGFARAVAMTSLVDLRRYSILVATDPVIVRDFPTVDPGQVNQGLITDKHLIDAITLAWDALADVQLG